MPIYEYLCDSCGKQFRKTSSCRIHRLKICPECKGKMKRIISGGSGSIVKNAGSGLTFQPRCGKNGNLLRQQNTL